MKNLKKTVVSFVLVGVIALCVGGCGYKQSKPKSLTKTTIFKGKIGEDTIYFYHTRFYPTGYK